MNVESTRTQPPPSVLQVQNRQHVKYLPFGDAEVLRLISATPQREQTINQTCLQ